MDFSLMLNGAAIFGTMLTAILVSVVFFAAVRSTTVGLIGAATLVMTDALFTQAPSIQIGLQIYPGDLISLTIGSAACGRFFVTSGRPRLPPSWVLFVTVLFFSFVRGVAANGTSGGQAFRVYFYAIAIASYMMTFATDNASLRRAITTIGYLGLAIVGLIFTRWVAVLFHISVLLPDGGRFASSEASELRVISSEAAIIVGDVLLIALFFPYSSAVTRKLRPLLPVLGLTILVLQHRSVWLAVFAGVAARFLLPTESKRAGLQLFALLLVTTLVVAPIALSGGAENTSAEISSSADRAFALSDTAQARLQTWQWVFQKWRGSGPLALLFGLPFGTSMERILLDSRGELVNASFSSHNYFVQTLFVSGILGFGATVYLFLWLLFHLYVLSRNVEYASVSSMFFVLIFAQVIFYLPYGMHFFQCMLLGLSVAYVQTVRSQQSDSDKRSVMGRYFPRQQDIRSAINRPNAQ